MIVLRNLVRIKSICVVYFLLLISLICFTSCNGDLTDNSERCNGNLYGVNCDKDCPGGCISRCNRNTGICDECKDGLYGSFCNKSCPIKCYGGYCDRETGKCFDCKHTFYGDSCQNKCLENCLRCNNSQECLSCIAGKYGTFCNESCYGYGQCVEYYNECIRNCRVCVDDHTCDECYPGFYGRYCELKCDTNCELCEKSTGNCEKCTDKVSYGDNCQCKENGCASFEPTGEVMDFTCVRCKNESWYTTKDGCCPCSPYCKGGISNCNKTNGVCIDGCVDGHFGEKCDIDKCSEHCAGNNVSCNAAGECLNGCEPDWYTPRCNLSCSIEVAHCRRCYLGYAVAYNYDPVRKLYCDKCDPGYYRTTEGVYSGFVCEKCQNCLNDKCNDTSGFCTEGCKKGWYYIGLPGDCSKECTHCSGRNCDNTGTCLGVCNHGYYGNKCQYDCPKNCKNGACDSTSGHCTQGCNAGYHGSKCYKRCNNCASVCEQMTGHCNKCEPEWYGDSCNGSCKYCIDGVCTGKRGCGKGCKLGRFGTFCSQNCLSHGCTACEQSSGQCLICSNQNNTGPLCQENCSDCGIYLPVIAASSQTSCRRGAYGLNCEKKCSVNCTARNVHGHTYCDRYTGACLDGCKPGNHGLMCDKQCGNCESEVDGFTVCNRYNGSCASCKDGFHGYTCEEVCPKNCRNNKCHILNKSCVIGCNDDWGGETCSERLYDSERITTGQLIGITVGVIVVAIFVIPCVVILCCKRRRHKDTNRGEYSLQTTRT